jgi:hypothetical protein
MARRSHADSRTGRTLAVVGGSAVLVWWLLRRGPGRGRAGSGTTTGACRQSGTAPGARPRVWVRADRIEVDGVVADLATVIGRGRAVGAVDLHATGDAVTRVVRDVVTSVRAAGIAIYAAPDLATLVAAEPVS